MKVGKDQDKHLTYCTNIHPGESWEEVLIQLKANLPELKSRLSPDKSFGVGLRLSEEAAGDLLEGDRLESFKEWLEEENLYVFTMNGFPYGSFHGERVKDNVYKPDWTDRKRLEYTINLAEILAELLPEDIDGGISTSPLSYKPWLEEVEYEEVFRISSRHLAEVAFKLAQIEQQQGKELHIDIEPEPDCLIENTQETVDFFQHWLFKAGAAQLAVDHSFSQEEAVNLLKRHIRVCYDTCHFAVEYEDPKEAIEQFRDAGIKIGKVQISAALKVAFDDNYDRVSSKLKQFEEDTYLHQVIERNSEDSLKHYPDLGEALFADINTEVNEWRIHFHVPIFVDQFDMLSSTQDDIVHSLELFRDDECSHFEIETYTWDVLPPELKENIRDSIEREYRWTLEQF
ncbi:metabolite traffic protein EboE [Aliifodinibius sp. S!AR15-10]|uniref:metabolite traffic protein EboE n=1 Tax=Aliifodinibius sp. S!AR15-10 TaxID=2950437 RepID=UPI0028558B74|nr:metabolite traffic protein EboE [Aliifodinibius sp. S!AR15-10]MDR8391870.1 metabolite traffic protein EboE [Aliifodinibius sp. S!AR15-10]